MWCWLTPKWKNLNCFDILCRDRISFLVGLHFRDDVVWPPARSVCSWSVWRRGCVPRCCRPWRRTLRWADCWLVAVCVPYSDSQEPVCTTRLSIRFTPVSHSVHCQFVWMQFRLDSSHFWLFISHQNCCLNEFLNCKVKSLEEASMGEICSFFLVPVSTWHFAL